MRAVACRAGEAGAGAEAEVEVPLVEGGAAVAVTEENKREWLTKLLAAEMVGGASAVMVTKASQRRAATAPPQRMATNRARRLL